MDPGPSFSERILPKVKTMTDGRSVDLISADFSLHFLLLELSLTFL